MSFDLAINRLYMTVAGAPLDFLVTQTILWIWQALKIVSRFVNNEAFECKEGYSKDEKSACRTLIDVAYLDHLLQLL